MAFCTVFLILIAYNPTVKATLESIDQYC